MQLLLLPAIPNLTRFRQVLAKRLSEAGSFPFFALLEPTIFVPDLELLCYFLSGFGFGVSFTTKLAFAVDFVT